MRTHWHCAELTLEWTAPTPRVTRGSVCSTLFGVFKYVAVDLPAPLAFRGIGRSLWNATWRSGQVLQVAVELCADAVLAERWLKALAVHIAAGSSGLSLLASRIERVESGLLPGYQWGADDEVVLDFLTPCAFRPSSPSQRAVLSADEWVRICKARLSRWLGPAAGTMLNSATLQLLCGHWHYEEHGRPSRSARERHPAPASGARTAATHYLNGCVGRLYVRGDLRQLASPLAVLERIQLNGAQQGLGSFRVAYPAPPAIDPMLGDVGRIEVIAESVLRVNDTSLRVDPQGGEPLQPRGLAEHVAELLSEGEYEPQPTTVHPINEAGGKTREIERLGIEDHVVHRVLLDLIGDCIDAELSSSAVAYRKQHSRSDAIGLIRAAVRDGYRFVAQADIEDFFPTIDHARLMCALDQVLPRADELTRRLVASAIAIPRGGGSAARSAGLPQGSPLSPALANLYLREFDARFSAANLRVVRYSDDFAILCRSRREAESAIVRLRETLAPEGLSLAEHKTAVRAIRDGFVFLGEHIDDKPHEDPLDVIVAQRKPLLVTEPYIMLGVNGDALDVTRHGKVLATVPLRRISELIVLTPAALSTGLLERCNRHKIPLSVAQRSGYQVALFSPDSREFRRIGYRQFAFVQQMSARDRLAIAAEFVAVKLNNVRRWVESRSRRADQPLAVEIEQATQRLNAANSLDQVRGHEGWIARQTFRWLQSQFVPEQAALFTSRERSRGAPDRLNSVLNFGYWMLWQRLNALVRTHGLDPFLGFLHDSNDNYETLVADLQEVFRVHVDRTVLRLVNLRQLDASHFETGAEAHRLTRAGAQVVAREMERTFSERMRDGVVLRDAMVAQVRALRRWLCDGGPFWLFCWRHEGTTTDAPLDPVVAEAAGDLHEATPDGEDGPAIRALLNHARALGAGEADGSDGVDG